MEEQNKIKHHKNLRIFTICRGCMDSNVKMKSLFEEDKIRRDYSSLSSLQVSSTDSLPEWLCWKCCILLEKFAAFKRTCKYSAGILLKYYSKTDPRASEQDIIKRKRRKNVLSLTKSATFITDYPPSLGSDEECNLISSDFKVLISLPSPEQVKEFEIKEESKADFESWYGEEINDDSVLHQDLKVEYFDDQFNDSDDEPVIKKIKIKKTKIKSNKGKRKKLKRALELPSGDTVTKKVYNTPAKNFDMSMVIISSLSIEEQLQEMTDARNTEEYAKAPYKCESCAKWFVHEIVYKEHTTKHETVSGQYMCELCSQHFNSRRNLTNHQETHANRYSCRLCGKVVISKQNIMSHMYTEHDQTNKQITCHLCQKIYKNRYTYAKHMRIHNNSKEYKCHLCPKVFLWKDNLNRHLTRHKSERPFSCDQCFKSFYLKENLKDHLLVHSGAKRFYCVECDLSYASQAKLNQHLKRGTKHLTPEQLTFPCTMCDIRYTNSLQLSMHIDRVHLNKRSHVCQQCDAAFVSKKTLQTHVRAIHEGYKKPKDHICETCGKGFSDKQVLKAHIRTHTGEKPFSCKYCGAKFAHSGAMYTHIKLVHLKQKRIGATGKRKFEAKKPDEVNHQEASVVSQKDALVEEDNITMMKETPTIGVNQVLTTLYVNRVNISSHDAIS